MKAVFAAIVILFGLGSVPAMAEIDALPDVFNNSISDMAEMGELSWWQNPPGSTWITINCYDRIGRRRAACYAPEGYKIRNLREQRESNDCRGTQDWSWDQDGVYVRRGCRVSVRAFIIPEQYCRDAGRYRFCR